MIIEDITKFVYSPIFVPVKGIFHSDVKAFLKVEMLNPGGSIKFKPAIKMIEALEASGDLRAGSSIIETTSGNMGVALSIIARSRGYGFVCVTDEKITPHNADLIKAQSGELVILSGSIQTERYAYINQRLEEDPNLVFIKQFENQMNPASHEVTTSKEILSSFPELNYFFCGAGTGGTIAGCSSALKRHNENIEIVAVDALGSAHFETPPEGSKRRLPGIGATLPSSFFDGVAIDHVQIISEEHAIAECRRFVGQTGWLFGASTGSVLAGMRRMSKVVKPGETVVGIAADSGERYLRKLYDPEWVDGHYHDVPDLG